MQLTALNTAHEMGDMDLPGFRLHALTGRMENRRAITVSGNWRLTFEFRDGDVHLLDYEGYY